MQIIGPEEVIFGVDDIAGTFAFLKDFGLTPVEWTDAGGRFEALDGTGVEIRAMDDPSLPPALPTTNMHRKTIYGCVDQAAVEEIAAELGKDREVQRFEDGSIAAKDDMGILLGFRVTTRREIERDGERVNALGDRVQRPANVLGAGHDIDCTPRTLSHVVYFVPDIDKMEAFYRDRLQFRVIDKFTGLGSFMQPKACLEHHTLFFLNTPDHMLGMEHIAFHLGGPTEVLMAGTRMINKGYTSFWGPGRHLMGSNWFWYFNSPLGVHFEFDADMDLHDETWEPRERPTSAEDSQIFLFEHAEKWSPGAPPPKAVDH